MTAFLTEEETERATKALKDNKAAALDEISAELLKHGGPSTIGALTSLMNSSWKEKCVPDDWRKAVIKLPKKGDISDCNNWRGITLLSVLGKVFCLIILNRLRDAVDATLFIIYYANWQPHTNIQ